MIRKILIFLFAACAAPCAHAIEAVYDPGFNELPSYAQGEVDATGKPPGFAAFWAELQSAVIRGNHADIAMLTIFPFNAPCQRKVFQLKPFTLQFDKQMQTTVMIKDPRIDNQYVEISLFNLIVSSPINHPEFHVFDNTRVSLNRLEFRLILSKWYWACW